MSHPQRRENFQPDWASIRTHRVPEWYHDAKLGIFIHWGLYSVPAWATPVGEFGTVGWDRWFVNNPYSEWYLNTLRIKGSPTRSHHRETYGDGFDYMDFAAEFNSRTRRWDPLAMARLFKKSGAGYVVLTSKHHDGFTLWPSRVENPHLPPARRCSERDLVGELTDAVRGLGMRMGLYYSGGLDWSFNRTPITTQELVGETINQSAEYSAYADAHWRELRQRYDPIILWNDIGYPERTELAEIVADFYNDHPDGLINDRFETRKPGSSRRHHDFTTPEYAQLGEITPYKWESCRGLGFSFGYNRAETDEHTISEGALVHLLSDVVSKNGNLLLNVGPRADGSIPQIQADRLRSLGAWLECNGEAVFGTRPWVRATGETSDRVPVRFTAKGDAVYAILLGRPGADGISLQLDMPGRLRDAAVLGSSGVASASYENGRLLVRPAAPLPESPAHALRLLIS
jgi:alpha-L-fucosidase